MRLIKVCFASNSLSLMDPYKRLPEDTLEKAALLSKKDNSNRPNAKPMNYKELEKKRMRMEVRTVYK